MSAIVWSQDLSVGIEVIDNQHRRIVDYINQLRDIQGLPDRRAVGEVLEDLVDYTYTHFAFEETMMEDAGYPTFDAHKRIHQHFIERVDGFKQRFRAGENVAEDLCDMLAVWLFDHIRQEDKLYVPSVTGSGSGAVSS